MDPKLQLQRCSEKRYLAYKALFPILKITQWDDGTLYTFEVDGRDFPIALEMNSGSHFILTPHIAHAAGIPHSVQ